MEGHFAQVNAAAYTTVEQSRRGVCLRRLLKNQNLNLRGKKKKTSSNVVVFTSRIRMTWAISSVILLAR
jgi:hypothetical protein